MFSVTIALPSGSCGTFVACEPWNNKIVVGKTWKKLIGSKSTSWFRITYGHVGKHLVKGMQSFPSVCFFPDWDEDIMVFVSLHVVTFHYTWGIGARIPCRCQTLDTQAPYIKCIQPVLILLYTYITS